MSSNIEVGYVYSFTFAEGHPDRVPAPLWWWKQPEVDLDAGEKIVQSFSIEIKEVMQREGLTTLYRSEIENGEPFNYFVNLEKSDIREGKFDRAETMKRAFEKENYQMVLDLWSEASDIVSEELLILHKEVGKIVAEAANNRDLPRLIRQTWRDGKLVETAYNDGSTVYHDEELSE